MDPSDLFVMSLFQVFVYAALVLCLPSYIITSMRVLDLAIYIVLLLHTHSETTVNVNYLSIVSPFLSGLSTTFYSSMIRQLKLHVSELMTGMMNTLEETQNESCSRDRYVDVVSPDNGIASATRSRPDQASPGTPESIRGLDGLGVQTWGGHAVQVYYRKSDQPHARTYYSIRHNPDGTQTVVSASSMKSAARAALAPGRFDD